MSRTGAQWELEPPFPATHYVDAAVYSDPELFAQEQQRIFNRCWIIACHESELPGPYDYRTFRHPGGTPLIVVRGEDGQVRSFYNICPHRGNTLLYTPAGNARTIRCIFHSWAFDTGGRCISISRGEQGYQDRYGCEQAGLREVKTSVGYGGFVWVNVDDDAGSLEAYIGDALGSLQEHIAMPLEVFHYHQAVVNTNYKLWHDTNSEFYHDYMHYFNRITGMRQAGYFDRKYTGYPNGHASVGSMTVKYDAYDGGGARGVGWPGLAPGGWVLVDIFPGMTYNLRTSVLRMDTAIPLAADKLLIEFRGLAPKSDSPAERAERVRHHNEIWGPFGRNLHEDLLGVHGQGMAMRERSDSRWVLHGREENMTIHDEGGMRHFYAEWGRRMGRPASDPFGTRAGADAAA
jgi:methanesulfonate monooxygenase large subunit